MVSSKSYGCENSADANIRICKRAEVVCLGMLAPRKFMQRRKKVEVFKDAADEADQKNWRKLMLEIEEADSAIEVLKSRRVKNQALPKDLVIGTLVRFKQLKKWNLVGEVYQSLISSFFMVTQLIGAFLFYYFGCFFILNVFENGGVVNELLSQSIIEILPLRYHGNGVQIYV